MGWTLKEVRVVAVQRSANLRGHFMAEMLLFQQCTLVWLDETGSDRRNFLHKYGYAIRGDQAEDNCFISRGQHTNAIVAISCDGVVAYQLLKETVNTDNFLISFAVTCFHSYSNRTERVQDLFSFWMICPCITLNPLLVSYKMLVYWLSSFHPTAQISIL